MSECKDAERGLYGPELASLGGFTSRATKMLAHLREAYLHADSDNAYAIERAVVELFKGHSFQRNRAIMIQCLTHGLDPSMAEKLTRALDREKL